MNRKSPSIHASENEIGKISTGNDKNNWIILEKNKIKRWYLLGKYKKYYTLDNGSKKYKVIINDKNIYIFSNNEIQQIQQIQIKLSKIKQIFIGKNTKKYSIYNGLFSGSSILVEIKKNNYIFIGTKIIEFNTLEPIIEFHSIMDNSSVIYPFALTNNYAYLILENVYLKRDFDDKNPYEIYYDFKKKWKRLSYKYTQKNVKI
jgi:hypothetical protein